MRRRNSSQLLSILAGASLTLASAAATAPQAFAQAPDGSLLLADASGAVTSAPAASAGATSALPQIVGVLSASIALHDPSLTDARRQALVDEALPKLAGAAALGGAALEELRTFDPSIASAAEEDRVALAALVGELDQRRGAPDDQAWLRSAGERADGLTQRFADAGLGALPAFATAASAQLLVAARLQADRAAVDPVLERIESVMAGWRLSSQPSLTSVRAIVDAQAAPYRERLDAKRDFLLTEGYDGEGQTAGVYQDVLAYDGRTAEGPVFRPVSRVSSSVPKDGHYALSGFRLFYHQSDRNWKSVDGTRCPFGTHDDRSVNETAEYPDARALLERMGRNSSVAEACIAGAYAQDYEHLAQIEKPLAALDALDAAIGDTGDAILLARKGSVVLCPSLSDESEKPVYPRRARVDGEQGVTVARVCVTAEGKADTIEIVASSGSRRLDESAKEWLEGETFKAGDVPCYNQRVVWRLDGSFNKAAPSAVSASAEAASSPSPTPRCRRPAAAE